MSSDPIDLALREVAETKHLLESLIAASEGFDYLRAKAVIEELRLKVRALGKVQARLAARQSAALGEQILKPFLNGTESCWSAK